MSQKKYLDFIPKIYDTLLNADTMPDLLEEFADICGARSATLNLIDFAQSEISSRYLSSNINDAEFFEHYFREEGAEEYRAYQYVSRQPLYRWVSEEEAWGKPASEISGNLKLAERFGMDRRTGVLVHKSPVWMAGMNMNFRVGRGNITAEEDAVSQIFLPHFSKVVEVSRSFHLLRHRYSAVLGVLDRLKIGLCIMTRSGDVIVRNANAEQAFARGDGVRLSKDRKIRLRSAENQRLLNRFIDMASSQRLIGEEAVLTEAKLGGGRDWIVEVASLTDLSGNIDRDFAGAFVFIIDPDQPDLVSTERLHTIFKLTNAEADVCKLLVEGRSVNEIAEIRGVSAETVRTQVKALLQKTNSRTQVDLVRNALRVNLPVEKPV